MKVVKKIMYNFINVRYLKKIPFGLKNSFFLFTNLFIFDLIDKNVYWLDSIFQ